MRYIENWLLLVEGWPLGGLQSTIDEVYRPIRSVGDPLIVRDHHDGQPLMVGLLDQVEDLIAGLYVQIPRGFVGEQDFGIIGKRTGDGRTLPLAAGEFAGAVVETMIEPESFKEVVGSCPGFLCADSSGHKAWEHGILKYRQLWQQVVELKDKADGPGAVSIKLTC